MGSKVLEMVETGNGTVTPVVSNLRIDPALVDGYLPFAHFFPSFFIRMLYLLHSLVKYICMPIYPRVLVYQDKESRGSHFEFFLAASFQPPLTTIICFFKYLYYIYLSSERANLSGA